MSVIKVTVYEDNQSLRELIKLLIEADNKFACVGVFEDAQKIVEQTQELAPDLVLMDFDMPNVNGLEGIKLLKAHCPEVRILMQTIFEDDDKIFNSLQAGADGYILKKTLFNKLLESIRDVMDGGLVMTPSIARQALRMNDQKRSATNEEFALNERELEMLQMLVKGYSYKMIASEVNLSYPSVNYHIKAIYRKMKVNSGLEAVKKATDTKLF